MFREFGNHSSENSSRLEKDRIPQSEKETAGQKEITEIKEPKSEMSENTESNKSDAKETSMKEDWRGKFDLLEVIAEAAWNEVLNENGSRMPLDARPGEKEGEMIATKEINADGFHGKYDVVYRNGKVDFSPYAVAETNCMITPSLVDNKQRGMHAFAEKFNAEGRNGKTDWTASDVKKYCQEHHLDFHECPDLKTVQLVPHEIHNNFKHNGGRAVASKIRNHMAFFNRGTKQNPDYALLLKGKEIHANE